jgi:hypothetical protein
MELSLLRVSQDQTYFIPANETRGNETHFPHFKASLSAHRLKDAC